MESITIHFGPKKVSSEDDEASTKKQDDEEETFKGPKGRTNVWWKDVKYTPPKKQVLQNELIYFGNVI